MRALHPGGRVDPQLLADRPRQVEFARLRVQRPDPLFPGRDPTGRTVQRGPPRAHADSRGREAAPALYHGASAERAPGANRSPVRTPDFDLDLDVFEGQRQRAERFTRRLDPKRPLDGAGVEARKSDPSGFRGVRQVRRVGRSRGAPWTHALPMRSTCPKKKPSSTLAFSSESEPWIALRSLLSAYSARTVPGAASAGSVAPMTSRR